MSSANTSLNGYEFGRSPRTTAPFWGESGGGAQIDDTGVYTDKTWSSQKISDELDEKADADDVYTKTETDTLLDSKAAVTAVYMKSETYTKAEVDELLSHVQPTVDAYTKSETDNLLNAKADKSTTYTKTEIDTMLSNIPSIDAYTKNETNALLADKADKSDTYTKAQVDNLIPDVSGLATKTELTTGLAAKADESELASYAKSTTVYMKSQTYSRAEVDSLLSDVGEIVELTQAEYNALVESGTVDPDVAYFIKDSNPAGAGTAAYKNFTDLVRPNNHDLVESNAVYSAISNAISSIYTPRGELSCAELTSSLLVAANVGNVYEMSDSGTTSALFIQGADHPITAGNNVGIIRAGQDDIMFSLMGNAFDLSDYQKKALDSTIQGASSVEGALSNLASQKAEQSALNSAVAAITPHLATVTFNDIAVTGNGGLANLNVGDIIPSGRTILGYRTLDVWGFAGNVIPVPMGTVVRLVNTYSQDVTIGTIRVEYLYI